MKIGEIVQESLIQEDFKKNLATAALAGTLATAPVQGHELPGAYDKPEPQAVTYRTGPGYTIADPIANKLGLTIQQLQEPNFFMHSGLSKKELKKMAKKLQYIQKEIDKVKSGEEMFGPNLFIGRTRQGGEYDRYGKEENNTTVFGSGGVKSGDVGSKQLGKLIDRHLEVIKKLFDDPNYEPNTNWPKESNRISKFSVKGIHLGMYPKDVLAVLMQGENAESYNPDYERFNINSLGKYPKNPDWNAVTAYAKKKNFSIFGKTDITFIGYGSPVGDSHPLTEIKVENKASVKNGKYESDDGWQYDIKKILNKKFGVGDLHKSGPSSVIYKSSGYRSMYSYSTTWKSGGAEIRYSDNILTISSPVGFSASMDHYRAEKQPEIDKLEKDF